MIIIKCTGCGFDFSTTTPIDEIDSKMMGLGWDTEKNICVDCVLKQSPTPEPIDPDEFERIKEERDLFFNQVKTLKAVAGMAGAHIENVIGHIEELKTAGIDPKFVEWVAENIGDIRWWWTTGTKIRMAIGDNFADALTRKDALIKLWKECGK